MVDFHRNGLRIQMKGAPAHLCTQCDHKTLDAKVALYIDHIVSAIFAAKQPIQVRQLVLETA